MISSTVWMLELSELYGGKWKNYDEAVAEAVAGTCSYRLGIKQHQVVGVTPNLKKKRKIYIVYSMEYSTGALKLTT